MLSREEISALRSRVLQARLMGYVFANESSYVADLAAQTGRKSADLKELCDAALAGEQPSKKPVAAKTAEVVVPVEVKAEVTVEDNKVTVEVKTEVLEVGAETVQEVREAILAVDASAVDPYEALTKAQIADQLEARGLPTKGTKAELLAALKAADEAK